MSGIAILAGHLLGDILLQNRWLARHKRNKLWALLLHCSITTAAIVCFTGWWDIRALYVFLSHWAIDGLGLGKDVWPLVLRQGNPDSDAPAPFWLRLLDDQALHIVALFGISLL